MAVVSGVGVGVAATAGKSDGAAAPTTTSRVCMKTTGPPPLVLDLPGPEVAGGSNAAIAAAARSRLPKSDLRVRVANLIVNYQRAGGAATVAALRRLPQTQAVVVTNLGLADLWSCQPKAATANLNRAKKLDPYGYYGTAADNLLNPGQQRGYPFYLPPVAMPSRRLSQLRAAIADHPHSAGPLLALAYAVQFADRPAAITAVRAALRLDPHGVDAQVAVAVLTYDKDSPRTAIDTLQALAAQYPKNPEVFFHLGLVEAWDCDVPDAEAQFAQIVRADSGSVYTRYARTLEHEKACSGR